MPEIEIANDDWGYAKIADIKLLLQNVSFHFDRHLNDPKPDGQLLVRRRHGGVPQIVFRDVCAGPHVIYLTAHNRLWAKFSYQFAHEYFHYLSFYERLRYNSHAWFEETLGEVASIFATRQMARSWIISPPSPNWSDYSEALLEYSNEVCTRESYQLPSGVTLPNWFSIHEQQLLTDPYQRELNGTFAVQIVDIFDRSPGLWEAVRYIPFTQKSFTQFLMLWRAAVPSSLRWGVEKIADQFGVQGLRQS
jgi:hypothetical protein